MSRLFVVAVGKQFHLQQAEAEQGLAPRHDMATLAAALGAELVCYDQVGGEKNRRAMAAHVVAQSTEQDLIFSFGEDLTTLILLTARLRGQRRRLISVGHSLSPWKKRILHQRLCGRSLKRLIVFSQLQADIACTRLGYPQDRVIHTANWTDHRFFHPGSQERHQGPIVAIGGEHRDYPCLIAASEGLDVQTSMGSSWARVTQTVAQLPANVVNKRRDWLELRELYQRALAVVVPLLPCDFVAGITSIVEAMACGAPVIVTRTVGLERVLPEGSVLWAEAGQPASIRDAIDRLRQDRDLAQDLSQRGRAYVEQEANLDHWIGQIRELIDQVQQQDLADQHVA